jgi:glycosyltransferase involved in cell wall biosynthesis
MKYNILIVYDVPNWAYHFRAEALMKYAPEDFSVTISPSFKEFLYKENYHLVFFLPFAHVHQLTIYCNQIGKNPVIASSFNIGWGYANNWLEEAREHSDAVIINNFQMWDKSGRLPNTFYLPNGVDRDIFKYEVPIENRRPVLLWCGSEFHRKIKGYDDILIPLKDRLRNYGLQLDLRLINSNGQVKYSRQQMAQWYNAGTIYLCASLAEGTPNTALEAASCGCTIVSTPVGNMPELIEHGVNGYIVKWDVEAFLEHALAAIDNQVILAQNMLKAIEFWSWAEKSKDFYDLFRKLIEVKSPRFSYQL